MGILFMELTMKGGQAHQEQYNPDQSVENQ